MSKIATKQVVLKVSHKPVERGKRNQNRVLNQN
jgi:hypothetical protein